MSDGVYRYTVVLERYYSDESEPDVLYRKTFWNFEAAEQHQDDVDVITDKLDDCFTDIIVERMDD